MISVLFGNKTAADLLLYVEKEGRASPNEAARALRVSLNMVQKQLAKFEQAGILVRTINGRKRCYEWNPLYVYVQPLRRFLAKINADQRLAEERDPADGTTLSLADRIRAVESLSRDVDTLINKPRYKPFVKTFQRQDDYDNWKKKQTNPWLV